MFFGERGLAAFRAAGEEGLVAKVTHPEGAGVFADAEGINKLEEGAGDDAGCEGHLGEVYDAVAAVGGPGTGDALPLGSGGVGGVSVELGGRGRNVGLSVRGWGEGRGGRRGAESVGEVLEEAEDEEAGNGAEDGVENQVIGEDGDAERMLLFQLC